MPIIINPNQPSQPNQNQLVTADDVKSPQEVLEMCMSDIVQLMQAHNKMREVHIQLVEHHNVVVRELRELQQKNSEMETNMQNLEQRLHDLESLSRIKASIDTVTADYSNNTPVTFSSVTEDVIEATLMLSTTPSKTSTQQD